MRARLRDGRVIELAKDCDCSTHSGPHWLHADRLWLEGNRALLRPEGDPTRSMLGCFGFAREEAARLAEKARQLRMHGVEEIFNDGTSQG